jgi:hypothetical protein
MTQVTYYTKEGFEKLKSELEHLIHIAVSYTHLTLPTN